ncbi:MAG TPA: LuxR C-terminal-related transcriptional regulator [Chryseosolibacter sp.]
MDNTANDFLTNGRHALSIGAWKEARQFLEAAMHINGSPEVMEDLAWACWWLNDMPAAFKFRSKAFDGFIDQNNRRGASRTASWLGLDYLEFNGDFAVANGWFQRAENLLEGVEVCAELGIVKLLKANLSFRVDKDPERALQLADETISLSKKLNNVDGQMIGEAFKGFIMVTEGNVPEGMRLLDEATIIALTTKTGDIRMITTTCCFLIDACERIRDYERAGQWCNQVKEICKRWENRAVFASCRTQYASILILRGDWKEAENELLNARTELKKFKPASENAALIRLGDLRRRQGRWDEAARLFEEVKAHPLKAFHCAALSYDKGNFQEALNLAERFLRQIPQHEKTERISGLELLIKIYLKLGRLAEAEQMFKELTETTKAIHTPPLIAASLEADGLLDLAKGNHHSARQKLEDAADKYDNLVSPFEASRVRMVLPEALVALDQMSLAESVLQSALDTFKKLGAQKDSEKAKCLLKNLSKGDPSQSVQLFTGREIAVLKLIAEGKNNEKIAETLFVSVRTVEKHLSNIYQKLGVSGKSARVFAASYSIRKLAPH